MILAVPAAFLQMFVSRESIPFHFENTRELEFKIEEILQFPDLRLQRLQNTLSYLNENEFKILHPIELNKEMANI